MYYVRRQLLTRQESMAAVFNRTCAAAGVRAMLTALLHGASGPRTVASTLTHHQQSASGTLRTIMRPVTHTTLPQAIAWIGLQPRTWGRRRMLVNATMGIHTSSQQPPEMDLRLDWVFGHKGRGRTGSGSRSGLT